MRTATIREMQHHLGEVLAWVERGEEVSVLRRKTVVARLLPPEPAQVETPNFLSRAKAVWGDKPEGALLSEILHDSRGKK